MPNRVSTEGWPSLSLCGAAALAFAAGLGGCASNAPHASMDVVGVRPEPVSARPQWQAGDFADRPALPPIDLTAPGAVGSGSAGVEIIDTRTVTPQIQADADWRGQVRKVKEILPKHDRHTVTTQGPEVTMPVGGVTGEVVTSPGRLFPGISQTPWTPPDPTLAVGPNHVISTVNMVVAFYKKDGTLEFQQNLDSTGSPGFFETIGGGDFTFDPKCFYDHYSGRFVLVALEVYGSTQSWISIAVSDDSDPNGVWYKYRTNSVVRVGSTDYWVDYPGFGYDDKAFYVTGNLFPLRSGGFGGVVYRSFDKAPLLTGGTATWKDLRDGDAGSVQAAQVFGTAQAPYFTSINDSSSIKVQAIVDPLGSPALKTVNVAVSSFSYPSGGGTTKGGGYVDALDGRIMNTHWRNGKLYTCHTITRTSRLQSRWYEFDTGSWPASGTVSVLQTGNIDGGSGQHTYYPAIYSNKLGDVGVLLSGSSSSTYTQVRYTGRRASDAPGTMGEMVNMYEGSSPSQGRWGDYLDIAVDPVDDTTFWGIGEYQHSGGWGTWIGSFTISHPCDTDCTGDGKLDINDWVCMQSLWRAKDPYGDFNKDGKYDVNDFISFQSAFVKGCP